MIKKLPSFHRFIAHLFLILALALGTVGVSQISSLPTAGSTEAPATEPEESKFPHDLSSPRAAIRTFILNMAAPGKGKEGGWKPASVALDLSGIPSVVREPAAQEAATTLYEIFNRIEWVDFDSLPETVSGDRYVYKALPSGEIALDQDSDGNWKFSSRTIDALPAMLVDLSNTQVVSGLPETDFVDSPGIWLRTNLSPWLFKRVFILENFQWFGLLAIFVICVILDRVVRTLIVQLIRPWLQKNGHEFEPETLDAMAKWIGRSFAGGLFAVLVIWLSLPNPAEIPLRLGAVLFAVISGVIAALKATDFGAYIFEARARRTHTKFDDILVPLVRKAIKFFILSVGIIFLADNMAVDVTSLLAGLGIGGLAFALAAKDTIENIFGSITILLDRPFQIGDWVNFDGVDGSVEAIGLRSTRVRTFYDSVITVPNSNMIKANIDNYGLRRYRRIRTIVSITYNTPPERIEAFCEGIRELIRVHPYTRKDYFHIYLNEFGAHSLDILLYAFVKTPDWATELRERHRLFLDIVRLAHRLGVEFAFPTQTLYLEKGVGAAVPNETPLGSGSEIEALAAHTRADVHEIVERMHRQSGQSYPPPPVSFVMPSSRPGVVRGGEAEQKGGGE